uniref:Uncharacterized protein n=1 Tax=Anguilla anguilla TaxID=7936 RepID=A0A0E9SW01_ANGAN
MAKRFCLGSAAAFTDLGSGINTDGWQ